MSVKLIEVDFINKNNTDLFYVDKDKGDLYCVLTDDNLSDIKLISNYETRKKPPKDIRNKIGNHFNNLCSEKLRNKEYEKVQYRSSYTPLKMLCRCKMCNKKSVSLATGVCLSCKQAYEVKKGKIIGLEKNDKDELVLSSKGVHELLEDGEITELIWFVKMYDEGKIETNNIDLDFMVEMCELDMSLLLDIDKPIIIGISKAISFIDDHILWDFKDEPTNEHVEVLEFIKDYPKRWFEEQNIRIISKDNEVVSMKDFYEELRFKAEQILEEHHTER